MRFYRRMKGWEQGRGPRDKDYDEDSDTSVLELGATESPRSEALEEYIAKIASCERSVYNFRDRFLEGRVLSHEQARALISSPAAAYLPIHYFFSQGSIQVPLMDHAARPPELEPVESDKDGPYTPVKVFVDPPGRELSAKVRGTKELLVPGKDGRPRKVTVGQYSVLNELRKISSRLPRSYPWKEEQTAWFVLTGEPPEVPAASGKCQASRSPVATFGTITMTIQPWVPAETVRKFYQRLQDRLVTGKPRALSERSLAIFRFVIGQQRVIMPDRASGASLDGLRDAIQLERVKPKKPELVQPSWRTLLEHWNRMYPQGHKWRYKDVRNFSKDFRRTEQAVVHPRYTIRISV